ncbi:MAG: outer membrane beta-barrel protein [Gemmatimonadetes bacterium]|nr:outer membrane beta-barrel protein [Gemmatimonadota bacterium]NIO32845.1 outer membrane beta-barrel protein [Gemmatimonadota bacterium]
MKRLTLTILTASLLVAAPAHAQWLHFGLRGGVNVAGAEAKGTAFSGDTGTRTGYHLGLVGLVDISSWFAIQTEVWYSKKGFSQGDGSVALDLTYVEIPVLAVVKLGLPLSPRLFTGPVLGLESGCDVTFQGEKENCDDAEEGAPRTKGADSGIIFGAGLGFDFGPGMLTGDVWYNHGLTDIGERSNDVDSIETATWYFSAAYMLTLGSDRGR